MQKMSRRIALRSVFRWSLSLCRRLWVKIKGVSKEFLHRLVLHSTRLGTFARQSSFFKAAEFYYSRCVYIG